MKNKYGTKLSETAAKIELHSDAQHHFRNPI